MRSTANDNVGRQSRKVCDYGPPLRRARSHDALGIARVHVQSWQTAYRGVLPQDYLDRLTPARRLPVGSASFVRPIGPGQA
jgi:hypothetical protein